MSLLLLVASRLVTTVSATMVVGVLHTPGVARRLFVRRLSVYIGRSLVQHGLERGSMRRLCIWPLCLLRM